MPVDEVPNLVPLQVAAERVGLHHNTLRRYIAEGRLKGYKLGRKLVRVDLNEVDNLLHQISPEDVA